MDVTTTEPPEFDARWLEIFPDQAALRAHVDRWSMGEAVPDDMTAVLRVARKLLVDSYADYEVALVAVTWSLLALEAALHLCLGVQGRQELGGLLRQAQREGLIDAGEFAVLDAVRVLRNTIVHGALRPSFPPGAAVEMVDGLHQAVADIYGRAYRRSQPAP